MRGDRHDPGGGKRADNSQNGDLGSRSSKARTADVQAAIEENDDQRGRCDPLHVLERDDIAEPREHVREGRCDKKEHRGDRNQDPLGDKPT